MARLPRIILAACCTLVAAVAQATGPLSVSAPLSIGKKTLHLQQPVTDPVFYDASGREVVLRGWNVSGSVKLASRGFKPFANLADAERSFRLMRQHTGANLVRFTLSWEGTHPQVDQLDTAYLDAIAEQVKAAIHENMFVFLDYHTDLYSRYLFEASDTFTGNGAPRWIIEGGDYNRFARCTVLCFNWSMHNVINPRVRQAYRAFWDNSPIYTPVGERHVQDEFLWQLRQSLLYLRTQFTPQELDAIVGLQPFNEPNYGKGHIDLADEFDNKKLWPFYRRVREVMNATGWNRQLVFAEPLVFWDTNAGFFTPPTGGQYLRDIPAEGFVFAPHFYDAARMGVTNLNRVENAEYFPNLDRIRAETRFLNMPVVLGEFGMWLHNASGGSKDYYRIVNGTYQAMEASDSRRPQKDRRLDFYTLPVSGTQWHWDIYKDQHEELRNGNPDHVVRDGDGWNGENFSAIKGDTLTVGAPVIGRVYPRAVQGRLVNFFYQPLARDGAGRIMDWAAIDTHGQRYFANTAFALLTWQGTHSSLPTEIFLPQRFAPERVTVITDQGILLPGEAGAQMTIEQDRPQDSSGGYRLQIQADSASDSDLHFALVVLDANLDGNMAGNQLQTLQHQLQDDINQQRHPVLLTGTMSGQQYPPDPPQEEAVQVAVKTTQFLLFRQIVLQWHSPTPVTLFKGDKAIHQGEADGQKVLFSLVGFGDRFRVCQRDQPQQCSRTLAFH